MNWKRYGLALSSCFVVVTVFDILWNAVLLHDVYVQTARFWRPADELNRLVPVGFLIMLGMMSVMGLLFVRFGRVGIRHGLEFGLLVGLMMFVGSFGLVTMVPWPKSLVAAMAFQNFMNNLLTGLFFGWLYKPAQTGDTPQADKCTGYQ